MMAVLLLAAVLAVLAVRVLQVPQVRMGLGAAAVLAVALAVVTGHGAVLIALAVVVAAGTLAPVVLLQRLVVPVPAPIRRAS
ncbi:MAG: hypothetical protein ACHP9Z_30090 [Streptosporangiales bacterium]